jgi:hypothetical protein
MRTQEVEDLFDAPPPRNRFRRYIVALLGLAMIGVIVAVAIVARNAPDPVAEVRVREPAVTLTRGNEAARNADEGEDLRTGDVVRTDTTGQAQVDLLGSSVVRLDTDSELTLRKVGSTDGDDTIALALGAGRSWNVVGEQSADDRYVIDIGAAEVTVKGTTFLTDCTEHPTCYVVGFEGEASAESDAGRSAEVGAGDCITVDDAGLLEECDEKKLGLIDEWVRENLAEDQQLELEGVAPTVNPSLSPSPTGSSPPSTLRPSGPRRTAAPPPPPTATAKPATAKPTEEPEKTKKPKPEPTEPPDDNRTPRPTPF